jgi:[acyl-carrier-protein] S-malonyltransferase
VLAFTLPDHGAEWPGMGAAWSAHPSWELVEVASAAAGIDVASLLLGDHDGALGEIAIAHLATFVLSLVALDAAERLGLAPMAVSGYGLGEYTALVAAGALDFDDGVRLVLARGTAASRVASTTPCATAVVDGLTDGDVEAACARAEGAAWIAGYDAPRRLVVTGTPEGVRTTLEIARSLGATQALEVAPSGGFHTPLLAPARETLRKTLATVTFRDSDPVVANVDARHHSEPADWPGLLSAQLCAPVRWRQSIETLYGEGVRTFVEFGAGAGLADAIRDTFEARAVQTHTVASPEALELLVERLIATPTTRRTEVRDHDQLGGRLVVASAAGPFQPVPEVAHAAPQLAGLSDDDPEVDRDVRIEVGDLVGWVGDVEIRSAFSGTLGGLLVIPCERVMPNQPIAWLHAALDT